MRLLNLKRATLLCSLILISSCSTNNGFEFETNFPRNIKVFKDSTTTFYLKIINLNKNNPLYLTNIKTSCQCVILSEKELLIKPNKSDSLRIELFGSSLGKNTESITFSNDKIKKFKLIHIDYEVTD